MTGCLRKRAKRLKERGGDKRLLNNPLEKHVVLGKFRLGYSECYYKMYNTVSKIFSVVKEDNLKNYCIINGRPGDWPWYSRIYSIESKLPLNECLKYILSNKNIPRSDELSDVWTGSTGIKTRYALIGKNADYAMGMNFYGKTKLFLLDIIERMSVSDIVKTFIILDIDNSYTENTNARALRRCLQDLDEKQFRTSVKSNKGTEDILKVNTVNSVMGCNYIIGTDGKLYLKDESIETDINIRNYPHKHIGIASDKTYRSRYNIKRISIDKGPEVIDKYGFSKLGENNSIEIKLPITLKAIRSHAFDNTKIRKLDLERCKNLVEIGSQAFYQSALQEITIPNTVKKLGEGVLSNCYDLKNAVFCNDVEIFLTDWVYGCTNLEYLVLPLNKMQGWDSTHTLAIRSLTSLKEIWTSKENVWIAQEMVEVNYKEKLRLVEVYKKYNMKNKVIDADIERPKVVIVRRK